MGTSMEIKSQAPMQPISGLRAPEALEPAAMIGNLASLEYQVGVEQVAEVSLAEAFVKLQEQLAQCRPALQKASEGAVPALTRSVLQAFEHVERLVGVGVADNNPKAKGTLPADSIAESL